MKLFLKIIGLILIICATILYGSTNSLEKSINVKNKSIAISADLQEKISKETKTMSEEEIINYSNNLTSDLLLYSVTNELKRLSLPNIEVPIRTHCVGYATAYTTICNYAFTTNNINATCQHRRGSVTFIGIDLTGLAYSMFNFIKLKNMANFFKDHDFVVIIFENGDTITVDPTTHDLLGYSWERHY